MRRRGVWSALTLAIAVAVVGGLLAYREVPGPPPQPAAVSVRDLPRVPWEGGPEYYRQFPKMAAWTDPRFFPIGVWYEAVTSQRDVDLDKAAGINTYFELTQSSDLSLVRANGMYGIPSTQLPGYGDETVGWLLTDEVDLWGHEGDAPWTGKYPGEGEICVPESALCGYTVLQTLRDRLPQHDGRARYANFGYGMEFFIKDPLAARFLDYTDTASMDTYWYTDDGICELTKTPANVCHLSASYGFTIDRMRQLDGMDGKRQPVYAFVEDGAPFEKYRTTITPEQLSGAVVNSLIHGARGVIYFNHNFGGDCRTQHVLRDGCGAAIRPAVTEVNRRITELAPVLNTQSLQYSFAPDMDTMLKEYQGSYYVFAMIGRGAAPGRKTLTLPTGLSAAKAEVLYENRQVPVEGGKLTDDFGTEASYHIYRLTP
ncbi:hypothetical protein [Amycolatopsis sacchari]|uniref:hypothetical protein n=1 Tax=Amycolatopsis sacchari TaxID=115433 RepID=UPI003EB6C7CF